MGTGTQNRGASEPESGGDESVTRLLKQFEKEILEPCGELVEFPNPPFADSQELMDHCFEVGCEFCRRAIAGLCYIAGVPKKEMLPIALGVRATSRIIGFFNGLLPPEFPYCLCMVSIHVEPIIRFAVLSRTTVLPPPFPPAGTQFTPVIVAETLDQLCGTGLKIRLPPLH